MKLEALMQDIVPIPDGIEVPPLVTGIAIDSRQTKPGNVFAAIRGFEADGHDFVDDAIVHGAGVVVVEKEVGVKSVPVLRVKDTRRAVALMARRFYGAPDQELHLIGVTGTNGKSTVTFLLESILNFAGTNVGLLGTMLYRWKGHNETAARTTPDSIDMYRLLRMMRDDGINAAVMEVSSHALALDRVLGMTFDMAVFTNLSRDHLDFHPSVDAYREAKAKLFGMIASGGCGVINGDDPAGEWMQKAARERTVTYGEKNANVNYHIVDIHAEGEGTSFTILTDDTQISFKTFLRGRFNVMNSAAAVITGLEMGLDQPAIQDGLQAVRNVRGRMETFDSNRGYRIVVDYAHTPEALENVLVTTREFTEKRLIVVFGCGGDRDRGKRPQMGRIAAELADIVFVTSDNPRREEPQSIVEDILKGIRTRKDVIALVDRKEAIHHALDEAGPGDTVLIAGKGHETYQEIGVKRYPFDDRAVAEAYLELGKEA